MVMPRRSVQAPRRPARGNARRVLSAFVKLCCEIGKPAGEVFEASHVERLLRSGQSEDAHYYLERFLLHVPRGKPGISPVASDLLLRVGLFKTLATVAAGGEDGAVLASMFADPSEYALQSPAAAGLHKLIALMHKHPTRASKVWEELLPERLKDIIWTCLLCALSCKARSDCHVKGLFT